MICSSSIVLTLHPLSSCVLIHHLSLCLIAPSHSTHWRSEPPLARRHLPHHTRLLLAHHATTHDWLLHTCCLHAHAAHLTHAHHMLRLLLHLLRGLHTHMLLLHAHHAGLLAHHHWLLMSHAHTHGAARLLLLHTWLLGSDTLSALRDDIVLATVDIVSADHVLHVRIKLL